MNIFAWVAVDMPGFDPNFCCHHLSVRRGTKPVAQKKRKMGLERAATIKVQEKTLLDAVRGLAFKCSNGKKG
jgi:hypothetical protein